MSNKNIVAEIIANDVKIITYDDGSLRFEPIEKLKANEELYQKSFWQWIKDWWNSSSVKPYVKVRDLADPFDDRTDSDAGSDGKSSVEVGLKVDF